MREEDRKGRTGEKEARREAGEGSKTGCEEAKTRELGFQERGLRSEKGRGRKPGGSAPLKQTKRRRGPW